MNTQEKRNGQNEWNGQDKLDRQDKRDRQDAPGRQNDLDQQEENILNQWEHQMAEEEKSRATVEKYRRDVAAFLRFCGGVGAISREIVLAYKQSLVEKYAVTSANSMLAAVNHFLRAAGFGSFTVRAFRIQQEAFRPAERELTREEYLRLLNAARRQGRTRLYLLMQAICATGIRVSELPAITVESLAPRRATVRLKGKTRTVILPLGLCRQLRAYAKAQGIRSGSIFVTKNGRPIDRSNILHEMKSLCGEAKVPASKVFPHNLRHLFAVTYYQMEKDICHLADILGHANINTTRIYTMVSCKEQERRIDRLGLVALEGGGLPVACGA